VASKTIIDDLYKVDGAGGLIAIDNKGNCKYLIEIKNILVNQVILFIFNSYYAV
jgi:isoaspartyl peptidase/L-asparaginase-like protein (Ntn-hydrolase superfamily)